MVVPGPGRGDDKIPGEHVCTLTVDRGVGVASFDDEPQGRRDMAVRRRDFARQNGLKSAEQPLRNARLAGQAGILEDQPATFRLLRRDQSAGFPPERPYSFVAPNPLPT